MLRDTRTIITTFTVRELNENFTRKNTLREVIRDLQTRGSQWFCALTGIDGPSWISPVGPQETTEWKEEWALMPRDGSEPAWHEVKERS